MYIQGVKSTDGKPVDILADEHGKLCLSEIQEPIVINSDSAYVSDIDFDNSDFTDWTGDSENLFKSPFSASITNTTSDNPKQIIIAFNRTIKALQVGLGENNGGDFSNVKISLLGSSGASRAIYDESSDDTKRTSLNIQFENELFNSIKIEFLTADTVSLSNLTIQKARYNTTQIQGQDMRDNFVNARVSTKGNLQVDVAEYGDTASIDAFARLRTSTPFTIFDSKQLHDKQPLLWDEEIGGSATSVHSSVNAETLMTVTASASDYVIRQTKQRFNYNPGKSQLVLFTLRSPQNTGVTCRAGIFDGTGANNLTPNNGFFFESNENVSWNISKNGTTTETVLQANWNDDTLDGSGDENNPSGIELDLTATQICVLDYEWLGVGRVRVGFIINGIIRYVHYFNHSNNPTFTSVYTSTPNLPIRYQIESDGTGGGTFQQICSTVITEGGMDEVGIRRSVDTGTTQVDADAANTTYAVKGIRLKSSYVDVTVLPEFFSMINEAADDFRWSLCLNPTIAGTFTYTDVTNSAVQEATGATANTVSDEGVVLDSGYAVAGTFGAGGGSDRKFITSLRIGSSIDGTRDEIVLCVTPLSAGADIQASLTFRELL